MSPKDASKLKSDTREQSGSAKWKLERPKRITASQFGQVITSRCPTTSERACTAGTSTEDRHDDSKGLIDTTEQRESLKREQAIEYELSLKADRQKRISLERANAEAEQKKRVQEVRAARVLAEPETGFVTVRV